MTGGAFVAYATAGVKEVWLVLGPERRMELFRQPEGGQYLDTRSLSGDATLGCESLPFGFPLADLFRKQEL